MTPAIELLRHLGIEHSIEEILVTLDDHTHAVAERRTGYVDGGISPFGQKHVVPTFVATFAPIATW